MGRLPEDVKKTLEEYVSYLDINISREKEALAMILPEGGVRTLEQADVYRPMTEPIVRTITAYGFAKSELYRLFPELKEVDKPSQPY